jgi:hypothetical protein
MAARPATLALVALAALAAARTARTEDNPACAQYREPMAYNACLARHGPRANNIGANTGHAEPSRGAGDETSRGKASWPAVPARRWQPAERSHGRVHMEFRIQ